MVELTSVDYWDAHWAKITLPQITRRGRADDLASAILKQFEAIVSLPTCRTILEIGGAPGGYLAFFVKEFGCEGHAVDYSPVGCAKTRENFRLLRLPVTIHQGDVFALELGIQFDLVYSLGFIEHFEETARVLDAHWKLVKPGGHMAIGVPRFVDLYHPILRRLAPNITSGHKREALDPQRWEEIERVLGLTPVRRAYVGGLDPLMINCVLREELVRYPAQRRAALAMLVRVLTVMEGARCALLRWVPVLAELSRINHRRLSTYAISIYKKREDGADAEEEHGEPESLAAADFAAAGKPTHASA